MVSFGLCMIAIGAIGSLLLWHWALVEHARETEREACAELCESDDPGVMPSTLANGAWAGARRACARAIRARGGGT